MGLAAADKDRGAAITVTSGAAALLATEFLAGAGDLGTLASAARLAAPIGKLPIDDAEQDIGAWLKAEDFVVELDKIGRASCREECVSTCRSRWSPYH